MQQPKFAFNAVDIRQALIDLPLVSAKEDLDPPQPSEIYIPSLHNKALLQEVSIVEGMRGAGKSFWTAVLLNDDTRKLVSGVANIHKLDQLIVKIGFGMSWENDVGRMRNRRKQPGAVDCGSFVHVAFHHSATIILPKTNLVSPPSLSLESIDEAEWPIRSNTPAPRRSM